MRVLITNDDGIASDGIHTLARAALAAGLECTVAAPMVDFSGASASLSAVLEHDGRLQFERRTLDELPEVDAWAVPAAPAFIVRAALTGAFGEPPDVVVSGVNHGPNTGYAILHSGTVGAALTAATEDRPALAVSLDLRERSQGAHWETAALVCEVALRWLVGNREVVALNVNVPNVPVPELAGFRRATLAPFGAVQTVVAESGAGYVKLAYEETDAETDPGTDVALIAQGWATHTPLRSVCEADAVDLDGLLELPQRDAAHR